MDSLPLGEILALGLDLGVFFLFRAVLRRHQAILADMRTAPKFGSDEELRVALEAQRDKANAEGSSGGDSATGSAGSEVSLEYAAVEGRVEPLSSSIVSTFVPSEVGVVKKFTIKDLKIERHNGLWHQKTDNIQDSMRSVPFRLALSPSALLQNSALLRFYKGNGVEFTDLDKLSNSLDSELEIVYDKFNPSMVGFGKALVDSVRGDVSKGIQETEKMLLVGTKVTAFGKILASSSALNQVKLVCPSSDYEFVLTRKTAEEVIQGYQDAVTVIRVITLVLGGTGLFLTFLVARRLWKEFRDRRDYAQLLRTLSRLRQDRNNGGGDALPVLADDAGDDEAASPPRDCVVCLQNPRDVILLNCGHVCVCHECSRLLPNSRCPVCRGPINRVQAFFIA